MRMVLSVTPLSARAGRSRPGPTARAAPPATRVRLEIESFMRRLSLCCCRRRVLPRRRRGLRRRQPAWMSPDWMRLTPLAVICFQAAASERAVEVNAARGVFDRVGLEAGLARVHRGPGHAEVGGQAGDEHGL